jgi:replicative DNA helicase
MTKLFSLELEKHTLSALLQYPDIYPDCSQFLEAEDFAGNGGHKIIFSIIKKHYEQGKPVDSLLISNEIKSLSLTITDLEHPYDYLESLKLIQINKAAALEFVKELKKFTVARNLVQSAENAKKRVCESLNKPVDKIIEEYDRACNEKVANFYVKEGLVSVFDGLSNKIEDLGNNPIENMGLMGPHPKLNELYGSLVRPGNISTLCSRSGAGKTTFLHHYGVWLCEKYDLPILALDTGEMSAQEIQFRQMAALSGVPLHLIETGKFRKNEEATKKLRAVYPKIQKLKYYYLQIGGKSSVEVISLIRRFYLNKVGRGNPTAIINDYWKSYSDGYADKAEWERVGKMIQDYKDFITGEIPIGILAGVQSNRSGIVTGKKDKDVVRSEEQISGGDRVVFYSSHLFILQKKTLDVLAMEQNKFGNVTMTNVAKCRHLGINIKDALNPVKMPDGSFRSNYINFDVQNFNVVEKSDLASTAHLLGQLDVKSHDEDVENEKLV